MINYIMTVKVLQAIEHQVPVWCYAAVNIYKVKVRKFNVVQTGVELTY